MDRSGVLYESLVEDAFECIVTIRSNLTLAYANPAMARLLGHAPEDALGRPVADFVHPDDLDRALAELSGLESWGVANGTTSFRLRHGDGSWVPCDVTAAAVTDGDEDLIAVYCRPAGYQHAVDTVLTRLLSGGSRSETLAPLLDVFDWAVNDADIAIAWHEEGRGHQSIATGLPPELTGGEADPGAPWADARVDFAGVHCPGPAALDPRRRAMAKELRRGALWVEPITDEGSGIAALVTVWSRLDGPPPETHAFSMALAKTHIELVLRWTHQVARLDAAAHTDVLTGLPNRRSLFDLLDKDRRGGALLFCDLDHFKPVNDRHGHQVGDDVLRQVADRLRACVRADDVVARTGGDEFVILAHGATTDQAAELAERISTALREPFTVPGGTVDLGISIGIAGTDAPLSDAVLARADQAMLADKARRHRRRPRPTRN
jgi:diguanylate cyclase (GGDEF)-like protein/PAS domain S-box-containing protein